MYQSDLLPDYRHWQGRESELEKIRGWFKNPSVSIIGIWGEAGIGKSTLAAKAFADTKSFQRKFWVEARPETSLIEMAKRSLYAFGMPLEQLARIPKAQLPQYLLQRLQEKPYLLAIDHMEALLTPDGQWREPEFEAFWTQYQEFVCRSVVLLSSREYPPDYFGWKKSEWLRLEKGLSAEAGAALLLRLGATGSDQERRTVSEKVQGHPLALSRIADWLRSHDRHNPHVQHLQGQGNLFQITGYHRDKQNISAEDLFAASFKHLPTELQKVLTGVIVLKNFSYVAAAFVAGQSVSETDLQDLERRALLQELKGRDRYGLRLFQLNPCIRDWLQRQLIDNREAHQGALRYYRAIAKRSSWTTQADIAENLEAFHHAFELKQYAQAFHEFWHEEKEQSCDYFLQLRGHHSIRAKLYAPLAQAWHSNLRSEDTLSYATLLNCLGSADLALSNYHQAQSSYATALQIFQDCNAQDRQALVGKAEALLGLGNVAHLMGQYERAEDFHRKVCSLFQTIYSPKGPAGVANAELGLSKIRCSLNKHTEAIELINGQVLPRFEALADPIGIAKAWNVLGDANQGLGNDRAAIYWYAQALTAARNNHARSVEAEALNGLGAAYGALELYGEATEFLNQAQKIWQEVGDRAGEAKAYYHLGRLNYLQKDYLRSEQNYKTALTMLQAIGHTELLAKTSQGLRDALNAQNGTTNIPPPPPPPPSPPPSPQLGQLALLFLVAFSGTLLLTYAALMGLRWSSDSSPQVAPLSSPGLSPASLSLPRT